MSQAAWQQQGWSAPPPYQPAPGPQPTTWSAPTHPGPTTSVLAVLAIIAAACGATVLPVIGSLAAMIMGAIALGRIKRTGEDGRLLAIWAIVLGAVTAVAMLSAALTGIAMIVQLAEQVQSGL
jgi:hypothetical protein